MHANNPACAGTTGADLLFYMGGDPFLLTFRNSVISVISLRFWVNRANRNAGVPDFTWCRETRPYPLPTAYFRRCSTASASCRGTPANPSTVGADSWRSEGECTEVDLAGAAPHCRFPAPAPARFARIRRAPERVADRSGCGQLAPVDSLGQQYGGFVPGRFRIGEGGDQCVSAGSGRTRCANSGTDSPRPSVTILNRKRRTVRDDKAGSLAPGLPLLRPPAYRHQATHGAVGPVSRPASLYAASRRGRSTPTERARSPHVHVHPITAPEPRAGGERPAERRVGTFYELRPAVAA
ncbi:hypothetical protein GA0115259_104882 [Streptomyces sp. MnatMP-M17]|nr:hypothetical protein GA0115259_104882 [Streptomyces sp. MnatMP-M17]